MIGAADLPGTIGALDLVTVVGERNVVYIAAFAGEFVG